MPPPGPGPGPGSAVVGVAGRAEAEAPAAGGGRFGGLLRLGSLGTASGLAAVKALLGSQGSEPPSPSASSASTSFSLLSLPVSPAPPPAGNPRASPWKRPLNAIIASRAFRAAGAAGAWRREARLRRSCVEAVSVFSEHGVPANVWIPFTLTRSNKPGGHAAVRYLADTFGPRLVRLPYQRTSPAAAPSLYEGQTALHVAIVHKDLRLVVFLVERGADVRARCYGPFFEPAGNCYYGTRAPEPLR